MKPMVTSTPDEQKTESYILKRRGIHDDNEVIECKSFRETSPILNNDEPEYNSNKEEFSNHDDLEKHGVLKDNELTSETIDPHTSFNLKVSIFGLIACSIIYAIYQYMGAIPNLNDEKFSQHVKHLQSKYNSVNPDIFAELESAVELINRTGFPLSFVFAHHNDEKSTKMTITLIKDLARLASQYLGNGSTLTISPDNLNTEEYGELLTLWRPDIEQSHTVVVTNLQQVPAHLAPVFHTMCDEVTPYVRGTIYLHTVDLGSNLLSTQPRNTKTGQGNFTKVEKRLRQSWPDMTDEIFDPLLTRIAGSVHILD